MLNFSFKVVKVSMFGVHTMTNVGMSFSITLIRKSWGPVKHLKKESFYFFYHYFFFPFCNVYVPSHPSIYTSSIPR